MHRDEYTIGTNTILLDSNGLKTSVIHVITMKTKILIDSKKLITNNEFQSFRLSLVLIILKTQKI